jgi:hypothetical protein
MIEFTGGEWWRIAGRGNVYACKMPETIEGSLHLKEVKIEGHVYTVTGVEMFAINDRTLHKGRSVGLLVRGPRKDQNES